MIKEKNTKKVYGDISLLIAVIVLSLIGTIFIYSASNYSASSTYNDAFFFVKKQLVGIVLGAILMICIGNVWKEKK